MNVCCFCSSKFNSRFTELKIKIIKIFLQVIKRNYKHVIETDLLQLIPHCLRLSKHYVYRKMRFRCEPEILGFGGGGVSGSHHDLFHTILKLY